MLSLIVGVMVGCFVLICLTFHLSLLSLLLLAVNLGGFFGISF